MRHKIATLEERTPSNGHRRYDATKMRKPSIKHCAYVFTFFEFTERTLANVALVSLAYFSAQKGGPRTFSGKATFLLRS